MAKWVKVHDVRSGPNSSYVAWHRKHPTIHLTSGEPLAKDSVITIHWDGYAYRIRGMTNAHSAVHPGGPGKPLYDRTSIRKTKKGAAERVASLKRYLASTFDGLTGKVDWYSPKKRK